MKQAPAPTMAQRLRSIWPLLALMLFAALTLATATFITFSPRGQEGQSAIGGPFQLQSSQGGMLTEKDMLGSPYLIFFGFTHCPDACPTALTQITQALDAAGPKGKALKVLFVSVDPTRDTREILASYLGSFDKRVTGLTGSEAEIAAMVKSFRAYARKVPQPSGDYTMDHSTIVYLMDKKGRFVSSLNLDQTPQKVAADWLKLS